ncbi:MAG: ribonuclease H-like domain-containing protein [Chromatiaceae bacterium]|nr:ribonuclease H-like domain-containing protein [Chromatiaceae bacterium]
MRLDQRLRALRAEVAPPPQPRGDLAERLRRLSTGQARPGARKVPDEQALAETLGAERLAPGVLQVQRRFELDRRHGCTRLGDCLHALPGLTDGDISDPSDWLFLDTETSGLAGGTGTWAFLCGLMRFEAHGFLLRQYLLTRLDAEGPYLEAIAAELETAGLLITYNGKSFDGPLLVTRLRLAGLSVPFEDKPHLDLLHLIRRAFARLWPDCRLATAERRLLDFARVGDLPGAEAPAAWLAWLRQGDVEGLAAVLRHNRLDLLSLLALAQPLQQSFLDPASTDADVHSVARFQLTRGNADLAFHLLVTNRERLDPPALLDLARLHRRSGEWSEAAAIWESLSEQGIPAAIEAQAKFLEHRERDYAQALERVDRLPPGPERDHRRRRLEAKLEASAARDDGVTKATGTIGQDSRFGVSGPIWDVS